MPYCNLQLLRGHADIVRSLIAIDANRYGMVWYSIIVFHLLGRKSTVLFFKVCLLCMNVYVVFDSTQTMALTRAASYCDDQTVMVWDVARGALLHKLERK